MQQTKADTLSVSITPGGPFCLDVGQDVTLTANSTGGIGPYTGYQWNVNGIDVGGATGPTFDYSSISVGPVSITVTVTDSSPYTSDPSNPVSIVVNSALSSPSASAGATAIQKGQSSTISITGLSGGTPPYRYQWLSEAPGAGSYSLIDGSTSDTYTFSTTSSTTIGIWSFEVQVTDSASNQAIVTSSAARVTVDAGGLTATVSPTPWTMDVGQSKIFTATPAGGSGIYPSYQWYVDGVVQTGQTAATFSYSALSPGFPSITATVTDNLGFTSPQSSASYVTVNDAPTVSLAPFGPLTTDAGQSLLCTATASGGTGPIHYHWYLYHWYVGGTTVDSDYNKYAFNEAAGSYSLTCTVTDSANIPVNSSASNSISIIANAALSTPTVGASASSTNRGQSSTLSSNDLTGGTPPYRYQWLIQAPGAGSYSAISGATSTTYIFLANGATAYGTWHFELQATDSTDTQATVTSSAATVEVCPIISFATNAAMTGDASGTVLSIDTVPYTYSDLQTLQFNTWKIDSTHAITATSKVSVIGGLKQYAFHDWTNGNGLNTATGTLTTPNSDTTVIVNYNPQYQIAVAPPSNGQITPSATAFYDLGNSQVFSISASSGYHISDVIIDSSSVGASSSYTFNSISTYHTISAAFAPDSSSPSPTATPTPSSSPSPSATPSPATTPTPTLSPTSQPTAPTTTAPTPQQTPVPTPTPTSAPTAKPNQTQTQAPTLALTETPPIAPTDTASNSTPIQNPSSAPTTALTTTSPKQIDPSTSGILSGEMAAMLAFIVAILIIVVLVFKKGKR